MISSTVSLLCVSVGAIAPDYQQLWDTFKADYGRVFNGDSDELHRFEVFKTNVDEINAVNALDLPYTLAINKFADISTEEMKARYTGLKAGKMFGGVAYLGQHTEFGEVLADSIDWTDRGAVTPVKDQGSCGSCWAFGTTGSVEGRWFVHVGQLTSLSEQQIMDCDKRDDSCDGGMENTAIEYVSQAGICSEQDYSYQGRDGYCRSSSCSKAISAGSISGYRDVSSSASALMSAVQNGPVNIGVDAGPFQNYNRGVMTSCRGTDIDHAVLLVGYGTDNGEDYWKIKNSWGQNWGEDGYIRLTRYGNPCAMLDEALYPVASSALVTV